MADTQSRADNNGQFCIQGLTSARALMPVLVDTDGAVKVSGSVTTTPGATGNGTAAAAERTTTASDSPDVVSLGVMDDWDESDRAKVNLIVGQAGVAAGTGASSATTQRTVTASDSPDVTSLASLVTLVTTTTPSTSLGAGATKTVTLAATPEVLGASTAVKWIHLQALTTNTGVIGYGNASVTASGGAGPQLNPGDTILFEVDNLTDVYISVAVGGEGVRYQYGA